MEHRIETSRGTIVIKDSHIFEIIVPNNEQLVLSFHGESKSFRAQVLLETAKEKDYAGRDLPLDKRSS